MGENSTSQIGYYVNCMSNMLTTPEQKKKSIDLTICRHNTQKSHCDRMFPLATSKKLPLLHISFIQIYADLRTAAVFETVLPFKLVEREKKKVLIVWRAVGYCFERIV